MTSKGL